MAGYYHATLSCRYCTKSFTSKEEQVDHLSMEHYEWFCWACDDCDEQFADQAELNHHIFAAHAVEVLERSRQLKEAEGAAASTTKRKRDSISTPVSKKRKTEIPYPTPESVVSTDFTSPSASYDAVENDSVDPALLSVGSGFLRNDGGLHSTLSACVAVENDIFDPSLFSLEQAFPDGNGALYNTTSPDLAIDSPPTPLTKTQLLIRKQCESNILQHPPFDTPPEPLAAQVVELGYLPHHFSPNTTWKSHKPSQDNWRGFPKDLPDTYFFRGNPRDISYGNIMRLAGQYSYEEIMRRTNEGRPKPVFTDKAHVGQRVRAAVKVFGNVLEGGTGGFGGC